MQKFSGGFSGGGKILAGAFFRVDKKHTLVFSILNE